MRTSSRNVAVLLFDEVDLWDVASIMHVASVAGRHWNWRPFRLLPTAMESGPVATRGQLEIVAEFDLASCPPPEILFIPGGYGARRAANDARITAWCSAAARAAEQTLAIGAGVAVLGGAGLLSGARVAAPLEALEWMREALPDTVLDTEATIVSSSLDGVADKLLTAASGAQGAELALRVVERCLGQRSAAQLADTLGLTRVTRLELGRGPSLDPP